MTKSCRRFRVLALFLLAKAGAVPLFPADWSHRVDVTHEGQVCVSYRARLLGEFLIVEATPGKLWHTFAMDNTVRAAEKLAGKKSLGIELPTEIAVDRGLEVTGPWFQSHPKDFSKPEQRWFSWGFDTRALFVARVRTSGSGTARVAIRGQACTEEVCKNIDAALQVPVGRAGPATGPPPIDWSSLEAVRR